MKKTLASLAGILLAGCTSVGTQNIAGFPFSMEFEETADVLILEKDDSPYSSYSDGRRVVIRSMSNEEFLQALSQNNDERYFEIQIYQEEPSVDMETWTQSKCKGSVIERTEKLPSYTLYKIGHCRKTYYIVVKGEKMYRFWEGDDSRDHERVWEILKTIRFDEYDQ